MEREPEHASVKFSSDERPPAVIRWYHGAVNRFVFLSRAERWPEIAIWPCTLRKPLPNVPVPLRGPDPDVALNLTAVLQQVYCNARYDLQVDYRVAPPPPELNADDAPWLDARLRAQGLRV